jgi:hypothetical protein
MRRHLFVLLILSSLFSFTSAAQLREIPQAVKDSFAVQYPGSGEPTYVDNIVNVQVKFEQNGEKKMATYTNKGQWKETERESDFEKLGTEVKDGFAKSRYSGSEWTVAETKIISRPGDVELYRIKVWKSDVQKKHLYFNASGKMVNETITL